jgi:hypothetical protein
LGCSEDWPKLGHTEDLGCWKKRKKKGREGAELKKKVGRFWEEKSENEREVRGVFTDLNF